MSHCLQEDIRDLIGRYGYRTLHEELMKQMRSDYEYMMKIFSKESHGDNMKKLGKYNKQEQRDAVEKKANELKEAGVEQTTLLTKENLTEWIGKGESYAQIAREHVGLSDSVVSAVAQAHGLQSKIGKMIAEMKTEQEEVQQTEVKQITEEQTEPRKYLTREEEKVKRQEHLSKVAKKRTELQEASMRPEDQLTKEKLEAWLKQGWTYWKVAEETGCTDSYVSAFAKMNKIQRQVSGHIYLKR